jgi:hypothetical protein
MTYSIDVTVVGIKADFDPAGNLYTQVEFGYRILMPMPPMPQTAQGLPMPVPPTFKHALHLIIPKEKWLNQFSQWETYHLIVQDDGHVELKKAQ